MESQQKIKHTPIDENLFERRFELLQKFEQEGGFKNVNAFEFEGVIFLGERIDSLKIYSDANESRSFYVWLHDTHTILHPLKNKKNI